MKSPWLVWRSAVAPVAIGICVALGCAPAKDDEHVPSRVPPATTQSRTDSRPIESTHLGNSGPEASAASPNPAATVPGIWAQIADERVKLAAAIQDGQLKKVHHLVYAVRDLVVALVNKAGTASPVVAPRLDDLAAQVRTSARKLDQYGDAGNLRGARTEYARLVNLLEAIEAVTNGHSTSE